MLAARRRARWQQIVCLVLSAASAFTQPSQQLRPRVAMRAEAAGPKRWQRVALKVDRVQSVVLNRTKGLPPLAQLGGVGLLYAVHTCFLSRGCVAYPVQLFPNERGLFQSVGYDSLAGMAVLGLRWAHVTTRPRRKVEVPWKPRDIEPAKLFAVVSTLLAAFFVSGIATAVLLEGPLEAAVSNGATVSIAMQRSLQVLVGHLAWVATGTAILGASLKSFWKRGEWFQFRWKDDWLWWVVGGYFVSAWAFNFADALNLFIIPDCLFDDETLVTQMINPENNDLVALATGAIAPCLTAPFWEETVYRGFLLPALAALSPVSTALPASALLFAAHHCTLTAGFPLAVLGLIWALIYIQSKNLLVTILIHALWNTRVFLGALFGL